MTQNSQATIQSVCYGPTNTEGGWVYNTLPGTITIADWFLVG